MNRFLALTILAFVGGFGAYTASRLSDGALAVVAGVAVGLAASTVIGILLIYAMRGRPKPAEPSPPPGYGYPGLPYGGHVVPPVVMMMPSSYPTQTAPAQPTTGIRLDSPTRVPYVVDDDDA